MSLPVANPRKRVPHAKSADYDEWVILGANGALAPSDPPHQPTEDGVPASDDELDVHGEGTTVVFNKEKWDLLSDAEIAATIPDFPQKGETKEQFVALLAKAQTEGSCIFRRLRQRLGLKMLRLIPSSTRSTRIDGGNTSSNAAVGERFARAMARRQASDDSDL